MYNLNFDCHSESNLECRNRVIRGSISSNWIFNILSTLNKTRKGEEDEIELVMGDANMAFQGL